MKLQAWRAFYQERYPERAQEYDQIVETYCHEEGWYPPDYTVEQHEKFRAEPYREDRHIDEDKLPEFQKRKTETRDGLRVVHFAEDDPISQRFDELDGHRQAEKSAFEEVRE